MCAKSSQSSTSMKRRRLSIIVIFLGLSILGCTIILWIFSHGGFKQQLGATCPPLPRTFNESNLWGTWVAKYNGGLDKDTIILNGDGTYKQIFDAPEAGFHYEGGWHRWWLEYRNSGYARLHLEKMRRCDDFIEVCQRESGGTPSWNIDYCENVDVQMLDGVILIVTGASEKSEESGNILLRQTRLAGSEWSYAFQLQEDR
jgi:hypothetical protein